MIKQAFSHVNCWVFDLDNTLYPPQARLFDQIEVLMTQYVMRTLNVSQEDADQMRSAYWREYGTTLAGLMREHQIDPDPYLVEVHDISFDVLQPDERLRAAILALPGRRIVYTNGTAPYAGKVLAARGLEGVFDAVYGIENAGYLPKPERAAFDAIFHQDNVPLTRAAMFEDDIRNLKAPFDMGLRTVLVGAESQEEPFVDFQTNDLARFLEQLV